MEPQAEFGHGTTALPKRFEQRRDCNVKRLFLGNLAPTEKGLHIVVSSFLDLLVVEKVFTALAHSIIRGLQQL